MIRKKGIKTNDDLKLEKIPSKKLNNYKIRSISSCKNINKNKEKELIYFLNNNEIKNSIFKIEKKNRKNKIFSIFEKKQILKQQIENYKKLRNKLFNYFFKKEKKEIFKLFSKIKKNKKLFSKLNYLLKDIFEKTPKLINFEKNLNFLENHILEIFKEFSCKICAKKISLYFFEEHLINCYDINQKKEKITEINKKIFIVCEKIEKESKKILKEKKNRKKQKISKSQKSLISLKSQLQRGESRYTNKSKFFNYQKKQNLKKFVLEKKNFFKPKIESIYNRSFSSSGFSDDFEEIGKKDKNLKNEKNSEKEINFRNGIDFENRSDLENQVIFEKFENEKNSKETIFQSENNFNDFEIEEDIKNLEIRDDFKNFEKNDSLKDIKNDENLINFEKKEILKNSENELKIFVNKQKMDSREIFENFKSFISFKSFKSFKSDNDYENEIFYSFGDDINLDDLKINNNDNISNYSNFGNSLKNNISINIRLASENTLKEKSEKSSKKNSNSKEKIKSKKNLNSEKRQKSKKTIKKNKNNLSINKNLEIPKNSSTNTKSEIKTINSSSEKFHYNINSQKINKVQTLKSFQKKKIDLKSKISKKHKIGSNWDFNSFSEKAKKRKFSEPLNLNFSSFSVKSQILKKNEDTKFYEFSKIVNSYKKKLIISPLLENYFFDREILNKNNFIFLEKNENFKFRFDLKKEFVFLVEERVRILKSIFKNRKIIQKIKKLKRQKNNKKKKLLKQMSRSLLCLDNLENQSFSKRNFEKNSKVKEQNSFSDESDSQKSKLSSFSKNSKQKMKEYINNSKDEKKILNNTSLNSIKNTISRKSTFSYKSSFSHKSSFPKKDRSQKKSPLPIKDPISKKSTFSNKNRNSPKPKNDKNTKNPKNNKNKKNPKNDKNKKKSKNTSKSKNPKTPSESKTSENSLSLKSNRETLSASLPNSSKNLKKKKKISLSDFKFLKKIGSGAYGQVYLVKRKTTQQHFALKTIKFPKKVSKNFLKNLKNEISVLSIITGDFLVKAFFSFFQNNTLFIIMEFLIGGDLRGLLEEHGFFDLEIARFFISQVILAVNVLHSKQIVHRDLKPENLLLDKSGFLKVADFGFSEFHEKVAVEEDFRRSFLGNLQNKKKNFCEKDFFFRIKDFRRGGKGRSLFKGGRSSVRIVGTPDYIAPEIVQLKMKREKKEVFCKDIRKSLYEDFREFEKKGDGVISDERILNDNSELLNIKKKDKIVSDNNIEEDLKTKKTQNNKNKENSNPKPKKTEKQTKNSKTLINKNKKNAKDSNLYAVDWWAVGCLLYEFTVGVPPFGGKTISGVFHNITTFNIIWPEIGYEENMMTPETKKLILRFLEIDPKKRLCDFEEIKRHPFFEGFSWEHFKDMDAPIQIFKKSLGEFEEKKNDFVFFGEKKGNEDFEEIFDMNRTDLLDEKNREFFGEKKNDLLTVLRRIKKLKEVIFFENCV